MLWTEILSGDFEAAVEKANGVGVIVVGCVEHHGRHLPLGQDIYHAQGAVELAAKKEPVIIFPPMWFGEKQGAGEFKGTIIFSSKLLLDILTETCDEMGRNGIKKIIIINGHGGNVAMLNNFARSTLYRKKDYMVLVYRASSAYPKTKDIIKAIDEGKRDLFPEFTDEDIAVIRNNAENCTSSGHGDFKETAMTYGLRPDLVDLSRWNDVDGNSANRLTHISNAGFYTPFGWMADYPNSLQSNTHDGLNERIAAYYVRHAVEKFAEAFKLIREDTAIEEYHQEWSAKQ